MNINKLKLAIFSWILLAGLLISSISISVSYAHGAPHQGIANGEQHLCSQPEVGHAVLTRNPPGMDATLTTTSVNYYWFNMSINYDITWEGGSTGSGSVQCY